MGQSASVGRDRRQVARAASRGTGRPRRSPRARDRRPARGAEALQERGVLGVDGQQPAPRARRARTSVAAGHQALLVGQRQVGAARQRGELASRPAAPTMALSTNPRRAPRRADARRSGPPAPRRRTGRGPAPRPQPGRPGRSQPPRPRGGEQRGQRRGAPGRDADDRGRGARRRSPAPACRSSRLPRERRRTSSLLSLLAGIDACLFDRYARPMASSHEVRRRRRRRAGRRSGRARRRARPAGCPVSFTPRVALDVRLEQVADRRGDGDRGAPASARARPMTRIAGRLVVEHEEADQRCRSRRPTDAGPRPSCSGEITGASLRRPNSRPPK